MDSTTTLQPSNEDPQQQQQQQSVVRIKKKCRGNRKLQHFKRKCRSRGMTEEQITEIINHRTMNNDNEMNISNDIKQKQKKNKNKSNKRKRSQQNREETNPVIRSLSQISISQEQQQQLLAKKFKTNEKENPTTSIHFNPV